MRAAVVMLCTRTGEAAAEALLAAAVGEGGGGEGDGGGGLGDGGLGGAEHAEPAAAEGTGELPSAPSAPDVGTDSATTVTRMRGAPAASAASTTAAADGAARCLLAADAVAQRECASRVEAAAALSLQHPPRARRTHAERTALASLTALAPTAAAGGALAEIPGDPGASVGALRARALRPCNDCDGCLRRDCGRCAPCRDKPKFGGPNRLRRRCVGRVCTGNAASLAASPAVAPANAKRARGS